MPPECHEVTTRLAGVTSQKAVFVLIVYRFQTRNWHCLS